MRNKRLLYGVIGAGSVADKKHLKGYSEFPEVCPTAICDKNIRQAKALAEKYGIPNVYADYREMLESMELDFVSVCVPNFLHEPAVVAALSSGAHVHCEKPLSINAASVHRIIEARDRSGRKLMVGMNNRFTQQSSTIKRLADEYWFGDIYHIRCGWARQRGIPGKGGWFTDKASAGGGVLIDLGVHMLDLALYFANKWTPMAVTAVTGANFFESACRNSKDWGSPVENGVYSVEDMAAGFLRLAGNCSVDFEFAWASNITAERKYIELFGQKGGALLRGDDLKLCREAENKLHIAQPPDGYGGDAESEFAHFLRCIQEDAAPLASAEQAAIVMGIIENAYDSAKYGREINLQGGALCEE